MRAKSMCGAAALALMGSTANAALVISSGATSNVVCTTGVCTATAANAVLNVRTLNAMLARTNMQVTTGTAAMDILVQAPVRWLGTQELTLDARRSIAVGARITVAGHGAATLATGAGGALSFASAGRLTYSALPGSLKINGKTYNLVNSVQSLAAAAIANSGGAIALAQDYDAAPDGIYPDTPIPKTFSGDFNGLGHTIGNFKLAWTGSEFVRLIGLFSELGPGGTIKDLNLAGAQVSSGAFSNVGLLLGQNRGAVDRVSVTGRLNGTGSVAAGVANVVGGLVGFNVSTGSIANSRSRVNVLGGLFTGGLAGFNQGAIARSYATGAVTTREDLSVAGGLVGQNDKASAAGSAAPQITESYATGPVTGSGRFLLAGGLVGWNSGADIRNCHAAGAVTGAGAVGERELGGLVGYISPAGRTVAASYATGRVKGVAGDAVGGLVGNNQNANLQLTATDYWDVTASGVIRSVGTGVVPGFVGLTTDQLKAKLPAGFRPAIWGQDPAINNGYPYLKALSGAY